MAGELGSFLGGFGGSTIGSAVVKLYLDSKAYQADMAASQAKTGTAATGMGSSLGKFKAIGGLAFAAVGTAAVAFAAKSISAARDQEEALNKVNVIFGDMAASVRTFAGDAAKSLGISETAALSAAGTFGNLFTNVGFTSKATAEMSTGLVKLAADLASFNNIDPTEALDKLRAGLSGEAEPLRTVGVFLSEAKVQAEAFSSGIAETGDVLTDQQKIQARYNLILQETGLAQGDFERTSGSLANQQRTLSAQVEDLAATFGNILLPAATDLVGALSNLIPVLSFVAQNLDAVYVILAGFAGKAVITRLPALLLNLGIGLQKIGANAIGARVGAAAFSTSLGGLALAGGVAVGVLAAIGLAFLDMKNNIAEAKAEIEALKGSSEAAVSINDLIGNGTDPFVAVAAGLVQITQAMEQAGVEGDALHFVLISVDAALREGKISVTEAAVLFDELGLSTKEAQQRANAFAVESTRSFNRAGKAIRNFAGLTGGELKEWRESTVESLKGTFGTISELGNRFDISSQQLVKGVDKSRRQTERFANDLEKLSKLDIADSIKKALLDEGPAAVDAFVRANDRGRRDIVADLKDQQAAFNDVKDLIDEISGKIDSIGKKKAKAEVEIHYSVSGVKVSGLPGFGGEKTPDAA